MLAAVFRCTHKFDASAKHKIRDAFHNQLPMCHGHLAQFFSRLCRIYVIKLFTNKL